MKIKYFLTGVLIFCMHSKIEAYNTIEISFFSFIGKNFSKEKTGAVHYHYDLHGNVKTIIQDNAQISIAGQRYKKVDYEYDLISGKVNAVHYQNAEPDQFHHKYEYDADNRITDVYTSKDKILWDHDAKYFYYPHGPLARIEYGDNHVQGMDYAYTLQGWVKAVNSETLSETRDIGHDGNPTTGNANSHFAKDVFGYSLTYFENDYQSIGTSNFEANKQNSDLLKARNDLFNGNISAMVTTITNPLTGQALPQGTAYKYDQLNRLLESKAFTNLDAASNTWQGGSTYNGMYHNQFTYDGNGNIETAYVKNNLGEIIDDQTYQYNLVNGKKTNNRLLAVTDAATQTDGYDLPGTQQASNYGYTELGELNYDVQDSIAEIKRRVDGKITEVIRTAGSTKKNLKFDYDATGNRIAKHVYTNDGAWIKSEFYVRDAQGNILSTYKHAVDASTQTASYKQTERHFYGSSLLGIDQTQTELIGAPPVNLTTFNRTLGLKSYTGANHLGNDLVIFTDKKQGVDNDNDGIVDYYIADVASAKDYGPFGEYLTGRVFNANKYPNSFNGKRDDEELFCWQDYGFRNYMKAVRRFDRVDDLHKDFPWYSPYPFAGNKPVWAIDLDGLEEFYVHGTWAKEKPVPQLTVSTVKEITGNTTAFAFKWSGFNTDIARRKAARQLANYIIANRDPNQPLTIVGHSHGGNVSVMATNILKKKGYDVNYLITINTPVREYQLDEDVTTKHVNIYQEDDPIQIRGGYDVNVFDPVIVPGIVGPMVIPTIIPTYEGTKRFTGEWGVAGRTFDGASNLSVPFDPLNVHNTQNNPELWKNQLDNVINPKPFKLGFNLDKLYKTTNVAPADKTKVAKKPGPPMF